MRKIYISLLFIGLLLGLYGQENFLQINGYVETLEGDIISGATATLYIGNSQVNSQLSDGNGKFSFNLDYGKQYKLIVTQTGMIQKRIDFNTEISADKQKKYVNDFAITLTKNCEGANTEVFKEPIDIISYEEGAGNFASNKDYFQKMQSRTIDAFLNIENCFQDKFNEKKKAADNAFKEQKFEEARKLYEEALEIFPNNSAVKKQLSQIDKSIQQQKQNAVQYEVLIKEADQLMSGGQLNNAKLKYGQASRLKPGDTYTTQKIQEIDKQLETLAQEAQKQKELDRQYNDLLVQASTAMTVQNYSEAKQLYEQAKTLKPTEPLADQRIAEAQRAIEKQEINRQEQEAKDKAFSEFMVQGQEAMDNGDFIGAQKIFQQALTVKPNASEPRVKISTAQKLETQRKEAEIRAKQEELEKMYNEAVAKADGLMDAAKYDEAAEAYKQALTFKETDKYANEQLSKAKNLKVEVEKQIQAEVEKAYSTALSQGDALKMEKKFEEAIDAYKQALTAKPSDLEANSRIASAQKLLQEQQEIYQKEAENRAKFEQLIKDADGLFNSNQYESAKAKYQEALTLFPAEPYPKNQTAKVDNILTKQAKEEEYNAIIVKADKAFDEKQTDAARTFYNQAQLILPEKTYPAQRINEISKLESEIARKEKQDQYDKLVTSAESAIEENKYDNAKQLYAQASQVMPDNPQPSQRINEINAMIDAYNKQQKDAKYNEIIAQADGLFSQKQYDQAKAVYTRATTEFPDKPYAKQKLDELKKMESDAAQAEKQAQYDKLAASAESAIKEDKYDEAKQLYAQASQVMPNDPRPAQRINEINAMIDAYNKQQKDAKYNEIIAQADGLFSQKQYDQAKAVYTRAATEFPDKPYAKQKLDELKKMESDAAQAEKQAQYDKLAASAESAIKEDKYDDAKQLYTQASQVMPNDPRPAQRINEINAMIDAYNKQQKVAKYNEIIAQADGLFSQKQYDQAKAVYTRAATEFPDKPYAKQKLDELKKMESDAAQAEKQAQYDKLAASAESAIKENKYDEAKQLYAQASQVMPNDPRPLQRINEINQILSDIAKEEVNQRYNNFIQDADKLFNEKSYEQSRVIYQRAAMVIPENPYPQQKINEINSILAAIANAEKEKEDIQNRYDNIVRLADKYFNEENYVLARSEYQRALTILENETYPQVQIRKIENRISEQQKILAEQQALQNQVATTLAQADQLFKDKKYDASRDLYNKVLELKPGHVHATDQIQRIDNLLSAKVKQEQSNQDLEEKYNSIIISADAKYKTKDYKWSRQLYLAALQVKPNEAYPRDQIKRIDNEIRALSANQSNLSNTNSNTGMDDASQSTDEQVSNGIGKASEKISDLTFKSESERQQYLTELRKKYQQGVTLEIYKEGNKTTKRYVVYRGDDIHEFREIRYPWGTSYTYDGKPTNSFHIQKNVKPREGEKFVEKEM